MEHEKYRLVIFDLDGTILNTLEDLAASINAALRKNGFPARSIEEVRQFVGNGIGRLVNLAAPVGTAEEVKEQIHRDFDEYYGVHTADFTAPYPGIPELLAELRRGGIKTAVVSNKPDYGVQALCGQFFPGLFDAAAGEKVGIRRKPAPDSCLAVMEQLGERAESTVYIGDSDVDIATAQNAGIPCISVCYGFRSRAFLLEHGAQRIAADTAELRRLLGLS